MILRRLTAFICLLILAGCMSQKEDDGVPVVANGTEVLATNLSIPWSIVYEGGNFLISERTGSIVKINSEKMERQAVFLKQPLSQAAEAGLLGFILHPEKENTAFAYYTYENNEGQFNRVVELQLEADGWHEGDLLIDRIPSGYIHHGGRIKIGPDSKLYITTGDAGIPENAQDLSSLGGKILRINLDGTIPSDNPFANSPVYSYGHRNPQGLTWDESGQLYSSEHGQSAHDEINQIEAGKNYGWPLIQGDEEAEGMLLPLFHSGNETWAPSGIAYHNGKLYVAKLRGEGLEVFDFSEKTHEEIIGDFGRVRDVLMLDDDLYFITNNTDGRGVPGPEDDRLVRIPIVQNSQ